MFYINSQTHTHHLVTNTDIKPYYFPLWVDVFESEFGDVEVELIEESTKEPTDGTHDDEHNEIVGSP